MESNARNYHWVVFLKGGTRFFMEGGQVFEGLLSSKDSPVFGNCCPLFKKLDPPYKKRSPLKKKRKTEPSYKQPDLLKENKYPLKKQASFCKYNCLCVGMC